MKKAAANAGREPLDQDEDLSPQVAFQHKYYKPTENADDEFDQYIRHPSNDPNREYTVAYGTAEWQFQIRLAPNKNNLKKAAVALSEVLEQYNLDYKLLRLAGPTPTPGYDPVQDYNADLAKNPHPDLDRINRHRLGQEFCVKLSYSSQSEQFQYTPEEYKKIMLECLKTLQDNEVQFGSLIAPMGALNIPSDKGIPPLISYSLITPAVATNKRNNVIPSSEHNPNQYPDPLEDVKITTADLLRHGINVAALQENCRERITRQEQHFNEAVKNIALEFKDIWDKREHPIRLSILAPEPSSIPLNPANQHAPFLKKNQINLIREDKEKQDNYDQSIKDERDETILDYEENPFAIAFLKKHVFDNIPFNSKKEIDARIDAMVKQDLKRMQILYLRLVHLEHEQKSLKNTLIFLQGELPNITKKLSEQLRKWQPVNIPLRSAFEGLITDLDQLPKTEDNLNTRLEIIDFIDSALPAQFRPDNPYAQYSTKAEDFNSDEERRAFLRSKLLTLAKKLDGKGPTWGKVLGAVMIVAGILLGTLCLLTLIPSLGLSAFPGVTLSTGMVLGGASFFAATSVAGAIGCYASRDTGASKSAHTLACVV